MFIFFRRRQHSCRMAFSLLESVHRIAPPASSLFGKLLHLTQNKSGRASTIPLDVYFFQRRRHDCRRAFSLLESVHGIISPVSNLLAAASTKNKAEEFPPIPLDVFLPMQTARLPHGVSFYSNLYFASVKPIRKAATFTKSKAVQFSPIPLDVYFFPTQTAQLPQGVFSTRICASNCSANAN